MASRLIGRDAVPGPGAVGLSRLQSGRSDAWRGGRRRAAIAVICGPRGPGLRPDEDAERVRARRAARAALRLGAAPAVVLVTAGLLARWSHPASRVGLLLILEGLTWNEDAVDRATYIPAASEIAAVGAYVGYAMAGTSSYPSGVAARPQGPRARRRRSTSRSGRRSSSCSHSTPTSGRAARLRQRVRDDAQRDARRRPQRRLVRRDRRAHGADWAALGPRMARGLALSLVARSPPST